jgi:hypothetical protein
VVIPHEYLRPREESEYEHCKRCARRCKPCIRRRFCYICHPFSEMIGCRDPFAGEQDTELLFRLFVATFCAPKNIVYKLFVWVCLKMTMKSRHYVVIFRADRTNFFHSYLSSTFYINNKAEDSLLKRSFCIIEDHPLWYFGAS